MRKNLKIIFIIGEAVAVAIAFYLLNNNPLSFIELKANIEFPKGTTTVGIQQKDNYVSACVIVPENSIENFIKKFNFTQKPIINSFVPGTHPIPANAEIYILESEEDKYRIVLDKNTGKIWATVYHAD